MNLISLNGEFVDLETARIPATDAGILLGDGVFETLRVESGHVVHAEEHFARLARGVRVLEIPYRVDPEQLLAQCHAVLDANQRDRARLRITITRGPLRNGPIDPAQGEPTEIITAAPLPPDAAFDSMPRRSLGIVPFPRNERSPLASIKCTSYQESLVARRHAVAHGYDEGLLLNTQGRVAECAMANLFAVVDGAVSTPPVSEGALPGTMRAAVLRLAGQHGLRAEERPITRDDLFAAEEIFITNSIGQIMPVGRIDEHELPSRSGSATARLHRYLRAEIEELIRHLRAS